MATLQDLSKPSYEQLVAMLAKQQADIEALKAAKQAKIGFRVNDQMTKAGTMGKKTLSVTGLGFMQPTLYASQWLRILDKADEMRAFIEANRSKLAWKE